VPASFEHAYEENVGRIYGFFAYRVGSRADAEDLTQLTFERALRAWHRYDPGRARLSTWLLAIARNALIDHRRRNSPVTVAEGEIGGDQLPTTEGPEERSLGPSPELTSALSRLRNRDREIVALRFGADLHADEIAKIMGLSVANVQQILSRALRKLRAVLEGGPVVGDRIPERKAAGAGRKLGGSGRH
jgi:RNA polymerase sigma-70 factor, ECF subfamily